MDNKEEKQGNTYNLTADGDKPAKIVIQTESAKNRASWWPRILLILLIFSVLSNMGMYASYQEYFNSGGQPMEQYHSGSQVQGVDKIALIEVSGTIMPPYTDRIIKSIKKAKEDERVKGAVLVVDSPGGFVADSHQIYNELLKLKEEKPIYVCMKRLAASGGYYVSMGAGTEGVIYAEPTTWTGSIGVIIPRYNIKELAEKVGIDSEPLKTGEFKDALSMFHDLSKEERELWGKILDESFDQFLTIIDENRSNLERAKINELATGQIYTAKQAKANGLIDEIGFQEDAIDALKKKLALGEARVVRYNFLPSAWDLITGSASVQQSNQGLRAQLTELLIPRAMYLFSWQY